MSKKAKQLVTDEYSGMYQGVDNICVVDLTGLDAISTHKLRGALHQKHIHLRVVRNALFRRAFGAGPLASVAKSLTGPCATVTGGESIIDVAKELVRLHGEMEAVKLKFGMIDGDIDVLPIERLAQMKTRRELQGDIVMLVLSPWRRIAGQITSPWERVAGCLKTLAEKGTEEQAA
jgi:large subunit ribosomal protein L10